VSDETTEGLALHESAPGDELEDAQEAPDPTGQDAGWWITHPDGKAKKKAVLDTWKRSDAYEAKRSAKERRNELTRAGVRGVAVVQDDEQDVATVRFSFSSGEAAKAPCKADQLLSRVVATLTVDPPAPDVQPNSDEDDEREAAQFAERVLRVEGSPAKRDDVSFLRSALDMGATVASAFALTSWHPQALGLHPLVIQAHPAADTAKNALVVVDPKTGEGVPADPATLIDRYVRVDGSLTDQASEAQLVWQGDYQRTLLRPAQVRLLPITATRIEQAYGAMVGRVVPLGEFIAECYDGERPDEEVIKKLVAWRPDGWQQWVPRAVREGMEAESPKRPDGTITDEAWVCELTLYLKSCAAAPLGAKVVVTGADEAKADTTKVTIGEGERARTVILPLPLAWFRWADDTATGDPKGVAGIEALAPHEEIRAKALAYVLDYMDRFGSPRTFLPMTSTMQPEDYRMGGDVPVRLNPGDQPFFESVPPLASVVPEMYSSQGAEMDTASGLEEAARGVSSPGVKSGVHAQQIIEQALVALSGTQQNAHSFMCRLWRNELEFLRAFVSVSRQLAYLGESGDVQSKAFTGVDLIGAGDVSVARGTGTMMARSVKTGLAREELQLAMQTGDQLGVQRYQRAITGNTTPLLGLQDDPHRARIARQVGAWKDAAQQQHEPAPPADPMNVDPTTGQPIPTPDPVAQQAAALFQPNPTDELPHVAPLRFAEIADVMASRSFTQADPRYQQALFAEYERMRQAAGVQTRAEQAQAQQQQQQQQQAMQMEQIQSKNADQAAKTAYAENEGGPAAQRMAMQNAVSEQMPQPSAPAPQ
jgi:hypothetical protein